MMTPSLMIASTSMMPPGSMDLSDAPKHEQAHQRASRSNPNRTMFSAHTPWTLRYIGRGPVRCAVSDGLFFAISTYMFRNDAKDHLFEFILCPRPVYRDSHVGTVQRSEGDRCRCHPIFCVRASGASSCHANDDLPTTGQDNSITTVTSRSSMPIARSHASTHANHDHSHAHAQHQRKKKKGGEGRKRQ
ncbi:hypothetical protein OG21DRAFT_269650 [Imleria badia]|nr:hypothetical protein OG21DRAFT_269650 [Imleria badia]